MTERMAINGVELAWHEQGDGPGPTLVLCHGFTGSSLDFELVAPELARSRRVVTLDQRGHGQATKVGRLDGYSIEQLVSDLIAFIEKVGGGPVDLLGHSMGGLVVMGVTVARPELVHSLILMDTSAEGFMPDNEEIRAMVAAVLDALDPAKGIPEDFAIPSPEQALIEAAMPADWQARKKAELAGTDAYMVKTLGKEILASNDYDVRSHLGEIGCPTTVIVGEHDHPLVDQATALAAAVAHGHATVIAGAYHSPQLTHPTEWLNAVEAHLVH
jgi:pimeloyl-ACP methyl ester carboxylesterase